MLIFYLLLLMSISVLILTLFFLTSKNMNFDCMFNSSFECGFVSYFHSRFSFSMHYFLVGMVFLLLDLELCFLMPFMNESYSNLPVMSLFILFVFSLILGLMEEWKEGVLEWKF